MGMDNEMKICGGKRLCSTLNIRPLLQAGEMSMWNQLGEGSPGGHSESQANLGFMQPQEENPLKSRWLIGHL